MTTKLASVFRKLSFIVPNKFVTKSGIKEFFFTISTYRQIGMNRKSTARLSAFGSYSFRKSRHRNETFE